MKINEGTRMMVKVNLEKKIGVEYMFFFRVNSAKSRYYPVKDSLSTVWYFPFLEGRLDHCVVGL